MKIRSDPDTYSLIKVTEGEISACVIGQPEVVLAQSNYDTDRHEYELCLAAVRACDQRRSALEALVSLMKMNYFATPTEPRDFSAEATKRRSEESARGKSRAAMRKKSHSHSTTESKKSTSSMRRRRRTAD